MEEKQQNLMVKEPREKERERFHIYLCPLGGKISSVYMWLNTIPSWIIPPTIVLYETWICKPSLMVSMDEIHAKFLVRFADQALHERTNAETESKWLKTFIAVWANFRSVEWSDNLGLCFMYLMLFIFLDINFIFYKILSLKNLLPWFFA